MWKYPKKYKLQKNLNSHSSHCLKKFPGGSSEKQGGSRAEVSAEKELYNMDSSPHLNIFKGNKMEEE